MKVYLEGIEGRHLIGRADIPDDVGDAYQLVLFGASSTTVHTYKIGDATLLDSSLQSPSVERIVLISPTQRPELLPGWQPFAS